MYNIYRICKMQIFLTKIRISIYSIYESNCKITSRAHPPSHFGRYLSISDHHTISQSLPSNGGFLFLNFLTMWDTVSVYRPEHDAYFDVILVHWKIPEEYVRYYAQESQRIIFKWNVYPIPDILKTPEPWQEYIAFFELDNNRNTYRLAALGIVDTSPKHSTPA
jgi:hypothetical protein